MKRQGPEGVLSQTVGTAIPKPHLGLYIGNRNYLLWFWLMSQIKAWAGLMSEEGFAMHFPDVTTSSGGDEGWDHTWQKSRRSEGAKIAPSRPLKVSIYSWVRELSECEITHSLRHSLRSRPMTLWKIVETLGGERPRMGSRLLRVSPLPISFLCSCTMR